MRLKAEAVLCFESADEKLPKSVREYRARYKGLSRVLDATPEILAAVDEDLRKLSQGDHRGRKGDFTTETILRALIVQSVEGLSLRDTVVEANVHFPTDSSLLWDTWRVASRLLKRAREIAPDICPHRFHDRKIKGLHLDITRYIISKSKTRQRSVKNAFRTLIERVRWIVGIAADFCAKAASCNRLELLGLAGELKPFLPSMRTVVANARRAQIEGEKVPASERVFRIFEPHTELIQRGKRQKPVEFGHKLLLCQTPEKFITDYDVFEQQEADCKLTEPVIQRHKVLFGQTPKVLAGDKGFCPNAAKLTELETLVETPAIPRRLRDFVDRALVHWQAFGAGIEGTISGLKRAFRLFRCFFRGFTRFASAVGLGVFCHNLIVLAEPSRR
jgi:IS5 family transposase